MGVALFGKEIIVFNQRFQPVESEVRIIGVACLRLEGGWCWRRFQSRGLLKTKENRSTNLTWKTSITRNSGSTWRRRWRKRGAFFIEKFVGVIKWKEDHFGWLVEINVSTTTTTTTTTTGWSMITSTVTFSERNIFLLLLLVLIGHHKLILLLLLDAVVVGGSEVRSIFCLILNIVIFFRNIQPSIWHKHRLR